MVCVPACLFDFKLLAHRDHPLQGRGDLKPEELSQYPSPAMPMGMAPALMEALQNHGLATQQCGLIDYDESGWEGFAGNGLGLSYGAPYQLARLASHYQLQPLSYALGLRDCIGLVGHRDVLTDPAFAKTCARSLACLRNGLNGGHGIQWLS
jgi:hypothetical protein